MNTHQHISGKFEKELNGLKEDILQMAVTLADRLSEVVTSIEKSKPLRSASIDEYEERINTLEVQLDTRCTHLLAIHSPTASDLRFIISAGRIVNDLESMGDEIARMSFTLKDIIKNISEDKKDALLTDIKHIIKELIVLLQDTLKAYESENTDKAAELIIRERDMNPLHESAVRSRITLIMEESSVIKSAVPSFWILRSLERIGKCIRQINNHIIYNLKATDSRHMSRHGVRERFIKKKSP